MKKDKLINEINDIISKTCLLEEDLTSEDKENLNKIEFICNAYITGYLCILCKYKHRFFVLNNLGNGHYNFYRFVNIFEVIKIYLYDKFGIMKYNLKRKRNKI